MGSLLLTGAVYADEADSKKDVAKKIVGTWQMTKAVLGGAALSKKTVQSIRLELTDKTYSLTGAESPDKGTCELSLAKKPYGIDVKGTEGPNKGKTFLAIFELDGDVLRVCYDLSGKKRPAKFESKEKTLLFLVEYKKVKP